MTICTFTYDCGSVFTVLLELIFYIKKLKYNHLLFVLPQYKTEYQRENRKNILNDFLSTFKFTYWGYISFFVLYVCKILSKLVHNVTAKPSSKNLHFGKWKSRKKISLASVFFSHNSGIKAPIDSIQTAETYMFK